MADRLSDPSRLAAVADVKRAGEVTLAALERISRLVAHLTGAPVALVNVIGEDEQTTLTGTSEIPRFATEGTSSLEGSFCKYVVMDGAPMIVPDAREDPRLQNNLGLTRDGVIAYMGVPLYAPSGHVLGALCAVDEQPREWSPRDQRAMNDLGGLIADELALREANRRVEAYAAELLEEARRDALTGLGNRRQWEEQAEIERSRAARDGSPLAVVLLDLDGFKAVNDTRGHAAGDVLLRDIATAWDPLVRLPDLLVRWGGDEFAALLPNAGAAEAEGVGERLAAALPDGIGVTWGVAEWASPESAAELVTRADEQLYARKRSR